MTTLTHMDAAPPVYKVGLVLLRGVDATHPEILITQPKPKTHGEVPLWVLPRGSRQYWQQGAAGGKTYIDIRDAATACAHADRLEPLTRTLMREAEEEAGIDAATLRQCGVRALGTRDFASRSKGTYPVHWFVAVAEQDAVAAMNPTPSDTLATRWATLPEIEAMAARGEFSPGYVSVIAESLRDWRALPKAEFSGLRVCGGGGRTVSKPQR